MSTRLVVHERIIPGADGDGFTPPEAAMVRDAVERIAPSSPAPRVGASLQEGPDGPAWGRDTVTADWYSNPNDAIAKAAESGNGGTVVFSRNTRYDIHDPLEVPSGVDLVGEDVMTTFLAVYAPQGIRVQNQGGINRFPAIRNMSLAPRGTEFDIGVDARGMTRFTIENVYLDRFNVGIRFGGDTPPYAAGWTGNVRNSEIVVPDGGIGMHFAGETSSGAVTANNIAVRDCVINIHPSNTTVGLYLEGGDTNLIEHCDIGYGSGGAWPIRLGPKARGNVFHANRSEGVDFSVYIVGGMLNSFESNLFGGAHATYSPVLIQPGGGYSGHHNAFIGNMYSTAARDPVIDQSALSTPSTIIMDKAETHYQPRPGIFLEEQEFHRNTANYAFSTRRPGDAHRRFGMLETGQLQWIDPATGAVGATLRGTSTKYIQMSTDTYFQISHHDTMPSASSFRVGSLIEHGGDLYFCKGGTTPTWVKLT